MKTKSTVKETKSEVKVEFISPAQASIYLLKNTINRPINERSIRYLEGGEIRKGAWKLTTDAIGFDTAGNLINGQHRMYAVVRSGKTLEFLVARGLHPDAFNVIDTGKTRSAGDVLGANGIMSPQPKSAIIRFVNAYKKGTMSHAGAKASARRELGMDNQDILNFYDKYKNKVEEAYDVSLSTGKEFKGLKGRPIGGMYWILSEIDREAALLFFNYLATGVGIRMAEDPIHLLRQKLLADLGAKKKFPETDKLAWMIIAWNHFRKGKTLKVLRWVADKEEFPKPV